MMKIMLKHRFNYWTCSKFADFIRGEKKPYALQLHEWDEWKDKQKKERPIRYWLSDTLLDKLQDFFYFPYDVYSNVKSYVLNRWVEKTHYLKTGLKPGKYYELDTRILHGLFNELVDYVEIELASIAKWNTYKTYTFKNGRCVEAVLDYFKDAEDTVEKTRRKIAEQPKTSTFYSSLMDTLSFEESHLEQTNQIKELYEWWTKIRPLRDDPYLTISEETHGEKWVQVIEFVLKDQYDEDTSMLIKLIKIRDRLWT